MNESSKKPVRVNIFGEEYALRSEMGEEYTRACAEHVDARIQSVHVSGHVAEPHKAAILAAMQITDDLFPYGVEVGMLLRTMKDTKSRQLKGFFQTEFSRVGPKAAMQITDDLFQERGDRSALADNVHHRLQELRKRVEDALDRGAEQGELGS